jgi:hypothetical protein
MGGSPKFGGYLAGGKPEGRAVGKSADDDEFHQIRPQLSKR